jgi:hypothetical protein
VEDHHAKKGFPFAKSGSTLSRVESLSPSRSFLS